MSQSPMCPELRLEGRDFDFSSWFVEKSMSALKHLARVVDRLPHSENEPPYSRDLAAAIRYNVSIFAMVNGFEQELDIDDADLILNSGTAGLQLFAEKYGVEIV